ncbi:hypothetical protein O0L34_g10766 [Tuta absoluta]|nr:hypothetical protein O0L34_g10766 [Tuta absoluta]
MFNNQPPQRKPDLLVCRGCLSTAAPLYKMSRDVAATFADLIRKTEELSVATLNIICPWCLNYVKKFSRFKKQCNQAEVALQKCLWNNLNPDKIKCIDESRIKMLNRCQIELTEYTSPPKYRKLQKKKQIQIDIPGFDLPNVCSNCKQVDFPQHGNQPQYNPCNTVGLHNNPTSGDAINTNGIQFQRILPNPFLTVPVPFDNSTVKRRSKVCDDVLHKHVNKNTQLNTTVKNYATNTVLTENSIVLMPLLSILPNQVPNTINSRAPDTNLVTYKHPDPKTVHHEEQITQAIEYQYQQPIIINDSVVMNFLYGGNESKQLNNEFNKNHRKSFHDQEAEIRLVTELEPNKDTKNDDTSEIKEHLEMEDHIKEENSIHTIDDVETFIELNKEIINTQNDVANEWDTKDNIVKEENLIHIIDDDETVQPNDEWYKNTAENVISHNATLPESIELNDSSISSSYSKFSNCSNDFVDKIEVQEVSPDQIDLTFDDDDCHKEDNAADVTKHPNSDITSTKYDKSVTPVSSKVTETLVEQNVVIVTEANNEVNTNEIFDICDKNNSQSNKNNTGLQNRREIQTSSNSEDEDLPDCLFGLNSDIYKKDTKRAFSKNETSSVLQTKQTKINSVDDKITRHATLKPLDNKIGTKKDLKRHPLILRRDLKRRAEYQKVRQAFEAKKPLFPLSTGGQRK